MFLFGTQVRLSNGALKKVEDLVVNTDQVYSRLGPILVTGVSIEQREERIVTLESGNKKNTVKVCCDAEIVVIPRMGYPKEETYVTACVLCECYEKYYIPCANCLTKNCNFVATCSDKCLVTVVNIELSDLAECKEVLAENTFFVKL